MKKVLGRPSPAMVVAIVALIAALGGTAVAGGFITKKKAKKVADNQITKRAPGLSVASAKTADNLADQSLQIRAWARVDENAGVLASKNVTSVVKDGAGRYCIDTPFTPNGVQATLDFSNANLSENVLAEVNDPNLCPAANRDVRIATGDAGDGTVDQGFWVYIN
jgi:hypothetical protein